MFRHRPKFSDHYFSGMARVLDLGATLSTNSKIMLEVQAGITDPMKADAEAIHSDWAVVGSDIRAAINQFADLEDA